MGIPVGVFPRFMNTLIGNLVSALFSGYPREIDLVFNLPGIHHDHMNQVLVNGGIEALKTDGAEKINTVSLTEIKLGMFNTGIVPNLGMQQKQSFFPSGIPDPENNIFPHPQLTAAMRTNIMVFHVKKGNGMCSSQVTTSHRPCQLKLYIYICENHPSTDSVTYPFKFENCMGYGLSEFRLHSAKTGKLSHF
jgi:hypothetical protein